MIPFKQPDFDQRYSSFGDPFNYAYDIYGNRLSRGDDYIWVLGLMAADEGI